MKTKLALLILGVSTVISSTAFAGDIKPLHTVTQLTNATLPSTGTNTAGNEVCDVYRLRVPAGDATRPYTSANVVDLGTVSKPKLGVKVGKWNGSGCVAAAAGEGQTTLPHMHVTGGGTAYDEGAGISSCAAAASANQWPLTGGSTVADGNGVTSKYSTMNTPVSPNTDYCVQVCKYISSQHTGTSPTDVGADTYTVNVHTHNPATTSTATSGHCVNHTTPVFVSHLCNDTTRAVCAYDF